MVAFRFAGKVVSGAIVVKEHYDISLGALGVQSATKKNVRLCW